MNEVEKMYKNAGIKKQYCGWLDMGDLDTQYEYIRCDSLKEWEETTFMSRTSYSSEKKDWDKPSIEYPPFTAEKQLEIIKWLGTTEYYTFGIFYHQGLWYIFTETTNRHNENFNECLASLVNSIWQDLTEEEKVQIKEILESEVRE